MSREAKLILSGDNSRMLAMLKHGQAAVEGFSKRSMSALSRAGKMTGEIADRMSGRWGMLFGGMGFGMASREVMSFGNRMTYMGIAASMSREQVAAMKEEMKSVGQSAYQSADAVVDAMDAILERTGNFELANRVKKDVAVAATATGAAMGDLGALASNLNEKLGIGGDRMFDMFDVLNTHGKKGAFTLREMANYGERLYSAAARLGIKGEEGLRRFSAWTQISRMGSGSSAQATTGIEGAIADILDPRKQRMIRKKAGFDVYDVGPDKVKRLKDIDTILKGIIEGTKGDESKLGMIFGRESIRSITTLARVYRETGGFAIYDELVKQGGDGKTTMKDFADATEDALVKWNRFKSTLFNFAEGNLTGPLDKFTDALDFLNNHPIIAKGGLYAILGLAGYGMARKVGSFVGGLFGAPGQAAGGALGGGLGRGGITPVYVMNRHLSMIPGAGGWMPGGGGPGGAVDAASTTVLGRIKHLMTGRGADRLLGRGGLGGMMRGGIGVGAAGFGTTATLGAAALYGGYQFGSWWNQWAAKQMGINNKHGVAGAAGEKLYEIMPGLFDKLNNTINSAMGEKWQVSPEINLEIKLDENGNAIVSKEETDRARRRLRGEHG